jgi:hypothetical protein
MIKILITNKLFKYKYFKDVTIGSTSLAKDSGKVYSDLRDRT